jgi:hypothetical protein
MCVCDASAYVYKMTYRADMCQNNFSLHIVTASTALNLNGCGLADGSIIAT